MFWRLIILIVCLLPGLIQAQYIGGSRPWPAGQSRDTSELKWVAIEALETAGVSQDGLVFDLSGYWGATVDDIAFSTDDYASVANGRWSGSVGDHGEDSTNYTTDGQGIICGGNANNEGIQLAFTDSLHDMTLFSNGDASGADDYIKWDLRISAQDSADMGDVNGITIVFACDASALTNYFYYRIDDSVLDGDAWTHFKVTKAAFNGAGFCASDTAWSLVKGISFYLSSAPDDSTVFTVDNVQMVKKDPDTAAPNPFQRNINGTWTADFTQQGAGNFGVVEEGGVVSAKTPGAFSSYLYSVGSFNNYRMSGTIKLGAGNGFFWVSKDGLRKASIAGDVFTLTDSAGGTKTTAFVTGNTDEVYYEAEKNGTSITVRISLDRRSWTQLSTFTYTGARQIAVRSYNAAQRTHKFGLSSVASAAFAAEAGGIAGMTPPLQAADTMQLSGTGMITVTNDGSHGVAITSTAADSAAAMFRDSLANRFGAHPEDSLVIPVPVKVNGDITSNGGDINVDEGQAVNFYHDKFWNMRKIGANIQVAGFADSAARYFFVVDSSVPTDSLRFWVDFSTGQVFAQNGLELMPVVYHQPDVFEVLYTPDSSAFFHSDSTKQRVP